MDLMEAYQKVLGETIVPAGGGKWTCPVCKMPDGECANDCAMKFIHDFAMRRKDANSGTEHESIYTNKILKVANKIRSGTTNATDALQLDAVVVGIMEVESDMPRINEAINDAIHMHMQHNDDADLHADTAGRYRRMKMRLNEIFPRSKG